MDNNSNNNDFEMAMISISIFRTIGNVAGACFHFNFLPGKFLIYRIVMILKGLF